MLRLIFLKEAACLIYLYVKKEKNKIEINFF